MVNNTYDYYNLTVIKCNACKNEVLNASPYSTLSLPIPDENSVSLFHCFNNLSKPEILDGYKCEKCNNTEGNFLEKKMITSKSINFTFKKI